jgi:hypothetical protein
MLRRILSVFLPITLVGAAEPPKMKTISYRGGVITFRVPATWKEEYQPEGGGTFYDDRPGSGTLRLNIITAKAPAGKVLVDGYHHFTEKPLQEGERLSKTERNDGILFSREPAEEESQKLMLYTWKIAHCVSPDELHIAIFTWTILASQDPDPKFKRAIEFIGDEISKAFFHHAL